MSDFTDVGGVDEFADGTSSLVEVEDELIVLIRAADGFYALDDVCTHDGGPLSDGELCLDDAQPAIACPRHGAKFALTDGAALTMPATKPTRSHEVKVEEGRVFVRLAG